MENPLAPVAAKRSLSGRYHIGYVILAAVGVCVMLAAAVIAVPLIMAPVQAVVSSRTVSEHLEGAQFLSDEKGHSTVYVQEGVSFGRRYSDSFIMSAEFGPKSDIRIARVPDGSYELRNGGRVLYTSEAALDGVDYSSDGKYIVYAEQATSSLPASQSDLIVPYLALLPNEWAVWTIDIDSGTKVRLGTGLRPFFIDDTHVARVAPVGVIVTDLVTGEERKTVARTFQRIPFMPLVSPDRTLLGIANPSSTSIQLYRTLTDSSEEVTTLPTPDHAASYTLGNDGLYTIRLTPSGSELWLQSLAAHAEESRVLTFPGWLRITRVLLSK